MEMTLSIISVMKREIKVQCEKQDLMQDDELAEEHTTETEALGSTRKIKKNGEKKIKNLFILQLKL